MAADKDTANAAMNEDGDGEFLAVGKIAAAMDEAGVPQSEVDAFMHAAMAHDSDHLLRTVMGWVVVR